MTRPGNKFRVWFLYEAEQRGVQDPATGFITYAEEHADKLAVFAEYSVTINRAAAGDNQQSPDVHGFPEVKPGDSGEWVEYLDTLLTSRGF